MYRRLPCRNEATMSTGLSSDAPGIATSCRVPQTPHRVRTEKATVPGRASAYARAARTSGRHFACAGAASASRQAAAARAGRT